MKNGKQIQTERGLIYVEKEFDSSENAIKSGYSYSFTSRKLGCDVYGKSLDDRGLYHSFALIIK